MYQNHPFVFDMRISDKNKRGDNMTEEYRIFTAYCRTLLRTLEQIECHLENIEPAAALELVKELISETKQNLN